jgi:hypothetical protein
MMWRLTVIMLGLAWVLPCQAAEIDGEIAGRLLAQKHCEACHASATYESPARKVREWKQLRNRVGACNRNVGVGLTPREEFAVADHLKRSYYKFAE